MSTNAIKSVLIPTWHDVSESDCGHGDEAEVECLEEGPLLPDGEDSSTHGQEQAQETQSQEGSQQIGGQTGARWTSLLITFFRFRSKLKNINIKMC